ncbi:TonB-dependent receptor plug domain-containing protein [Helicobacter sp. 23-1044]
MKRSLYFLTLWAIFAVQGVADSESRFNFVILSEAKNLKNIQIDSSLVSLAQNDKVEVDSRDSNVNKIQDFGANQRQDLSDSNKNLRESKNAKNTPPQTPPARGGAYFNSPSQMRAGDSRKLSPSLAEGDKGGGLDSLKSNADSSNSTFAPPQERFLRIAQVDSNSNSNAESTQDSQDSYESHDDYEVVDIGTSTIRAKAEYEVYQSGSSVSKDTLDSSPNANGDITSILKILPNVQFSKQQNSSSTPGEIDPADISISGGLYYQNSFLLDGFNMNNDLDPANGSSYTETTALPGRSQGLNIDSSLVDSITVLDSNVSASYGGFSGGVVEATTKKATKKFGANLSYQISQGNANPTKHSMTQYHIYERTDTTYQNFLNSSSAGNQPEFTKHSIRASVESKFHEQAGIVASFSTIQSFIPLNSGSATYLANTLDDTRKTQKRQSYNLFLKAHYDPIDSLSLEAQYAYMPQYNNYFIYNAKDSAFDFLSGGHQGGLKASWDNGVGFFTAQTNVNYMDSSRVNSAPNMMGWRASAEKNWTSDLTNGTVSEGSYGNVNTKQLNATLKIAQEFEPLTLDIWKNTFNVGAEYIYTNAYYERMEDMWFFGSAFMRPLQAGQTCLEGDIACSNSPVYFTGTSGGQNWANNNGQYAYRTSFYKAGKINLDNHAIGAWVEDDMKLDFGNGGDMNARIGLRLDYDTLMSKATIAPRFSLNYILPYSKWESGRDFATQLTFGANRYYGRNLFAYKLMDSRSALQYTLQRNSYISWDNATTTQNKNDTNFKKIRVPYSDELMGGITQRIYMFVISAKYIYRAGKDEIRRMCQAPDGSISSMNCTSNVYIEGLINTRDLRFVYTNEGRSASDIVSLSISNNGGLDFGDVKNNISLAFDWTNVRRNYDDYDTSMTADELNNEMIWYGGQVVSYANKPATNFAQPYTFRLNTTTTFPIKSTKWLWNNFFSWKSPYYAMANIRESTQKFKDLKAQYPEITAAFEKYRVPFSFSWDMRVGFEVDIYKGNTLYVNLDILNVLNNKNLIIASATYADNAGATAIPVYEVGRQFWLQVGYKF